VSVKTLQPLRIADVGLASGYVLGIACIDEKHRKATGVEELEDRDPVDAGRLHDNCQSIYYDPSPILLLRCGRAGLRC